MQALIIAILAALFIAVTLLPLNKMFQKRYLHKLLILLKEKNISPNDNKKTFIQKFSLYGYKTFKLLKIKLKEERYNRYKNKTIIAGMSDDLTVEAFYGTKILAVIIALTYFLLIFIAKPTFMSLAILFIGPLLAFSYPDALINSRIKKRQWEIQVELPAILNTLVIVTDAGLNLFEAIRRVCEIRNGTLVYELKKVLDEINMGILQKDALIHLSERCQINEITVFVFTITQSIEKGAEGVTLALKEQAREVWEKRKNKARELGEKASLRLFMPMLLLAFPCLLIFLLGPALLSLLSFFKR